LGSPRHDARLHPSKAWRLGRFTLFGLCAAPAQAAVSPETAYVFNTLLFLIGGFLVMWMAAGFAMLEAGFVRTKHAAVICLKNIGLYSIAGLMFFLIGYNLMYSQRGRQRACFGTPCPGPKRNRR
jgi:Amt family ammonium transporter